MNPVIDDDRFRALLAEHASATLLFAYALMDDPAAAEDVAQEAMLAAWRARAEFDPKRSDLRSWLRGFARNFARKAWARRHDESLSDAMIETLLCDPLLEEGVTTAAGEALEDCLEGLASEDHAVVTDYYGRPDHDALAREVGLESGALRIKVHRIRLQLRQCVESKLRLPTPQQIRRPL